jgi:hypothetical protein
MSKNIIDKQLNDVNKKNNKEKNNKEKNNKEKNIKNKQLENSTDYIKIKSNIFLFPRLPHEQDIFYYERRNFITNNKPTTQAKYLYFLKYSMIYVNMKYLKCRYHPEIEETVKKYINV